MRGRRTVKSVCVGIVKFQSTPPCGGDVNPNVLTTANRISIHAPLRGRRPCPHGPCPEGQFQSTLPCGGDFRRPYVITCGSTFQSTPPCGGDNGPQARTQTLHHFNPRPLAGATKTIQDLLEHYNISIHAPLRGRLLKRFMKRFILNFNPRPLAGAT